MANSTVGVVLKNLNEVLLHYIKLSLNAKEELEMLCDDFGFMEAYLKDAPELKKIKGTNVFIEWERQVNVAVGLAQDIINSCEAHYKKNYWKRLFTKGLSLAEQVRSLREVKMKPLLEHARKEFANFQIAGPSRVSRQKALRRENIVGMKTTKDTLIGYLINENPKTLEVTSITGMPGLGKTTLAGIIFHDPEIQNEFKTRIWIYVSHDLKIEDVFLTILKNSTTEDMSGKNIDILESLVRKYLKNIKFLIVFDDVWTHEAWDAIQDVLPRDNKMGKVLMTTRDDEVASRASSRSHKLEFLTVDEGWELLQFEVFDKVGDCPKKLEDVGKLIAKNCGGLPLPIVVIGGIIKRLQKKRANTAIMKVWEDVSESMILDEDKDQQIVNVISLSYTNLPQDLRKCFLYLGMFPGGTEIPSWRLTQLWIAEGFIQQMSERSLEDIAQDNLMELISRNLLIVNKTKSSDGEVKTCSVHDIIREFCIKEAAVGKENLFQEIRMSRAGVFQPSIEEIQNRRRLCIHSCVEEFLGRKPNVRTAHSFLVSSRPPVNLETKDIPFLINAFDVLRVLDANNTIRFHKFPSKLTKLVLLRYISLSSDKFKVLPKAISKLSYVQTLLVETSSPTLKVEANIWKMEQLKHLKTKASIILKKDGKGQGGEYLQTLSRLSPKSCTDTVFNKAKNLKTLGIRGDLNTLVDSTCLEKLKHLKKLKLVHDVFNKTPDKNPLRGLPQTFPPNLRNLTLSATSLPWTDISTVGELTTLRVLKLKDNAFIGDHWNVQVGGFQCLQLLNIEQTDLKFWTASHDAFPYLTDLLLKNCEKLQEIPVDIVKKLEMLSMKSVNKYVVSSAKKIKLAENQTTPELEGGLKLIIAPEDDIIEIEG